MFQSQTHQWEAEARTTEELKAILSCSLTKNAFSGCGLDIRLQEMTNPLLSHFSSGATTSLDNLYAAGARCSLPSERITSQPDSTGDVLPTPVSSEQTPPAENRHRPSHEVPSKPVSALSRMISKAKQKFQKQEGISEMVRDKDRTAGGSEGAQRLSFKRSRAHSDDDSDGSEFGIQEDLLLSARPTKELKASAPLEEREMDEKHLSSMTREEFLKQFKRVPRRGEIGQSAEEIQAAESLGYVMSGGRSKAAQLYVDRVQRQLHERDAAKREQQFRQVEDEISSKRLIADLTRYITEKVRE